MKFPDRKVLGSVRIENAGTFDIVMVKRTDPSGRGDNSAALPRYQCVGGAGMVDDPEGQWVHVRDLGLDMWNLDPLVRRR